MACDLLYHKEIAKALLHANIAHAATVYAEAHQRAQKIPMGKGIACKVGGAQTEDRVILRDVVEIIGKIDKAFPLGSFETAPKPQTLRISKKELRHFLLTGREKAGGG